MREILFRGKTYDGEWVEGWLSPICKKYDLCIAGAQDLKVYPIDPETVGQYTGLTDRNDKKIFEGDIVQYTDEEGYYPEEQCEFVGKIVFVHGAYGIATDENIPIDLNDWCDNDNFVSLWELYWNLSIEGETLDMLEIIGNIHDKPELLKEGADNG